MVKSKKLSIGVVVLVVMTSLIMASVAFASNDNYGYSFYLGSGHQNAYSGARYRQTSNENNKWKVNLVYNSEGSGGKATFWLAKDNKNRTVVSYTHTIKQGSGAHYYGATAAASRTNVRLGGENNNSNPCSVSGYWDEETD